MHSRTPAAAQPVPKLTRTTAPAIPAVTGRHARMPLPNPCPRQWRKGTRRHQLHSSRFVVVASSCHATGRQVMGANWCAGFAGFAGVAQCGAAWVRIMRPHLCPLEAASEANAAAALAVDDREVGAPLRSFPTASARRPEQLARRRQAGQPHGRRCDGLICHVGEHDFFVSNRTSRY